MAGLGPHESAPPLGEAQLHALRSVIPELTTPRLRLRAPALEDFGIYAEIVQGSDGGFLLEHPSREAAWFDFANMTACWLLRGHGLWSVEARCAMRPNSVGGAPLHVGQTLDFTLLGFEPGDHEPELGYMLAAEARGLGIASEAARRALDYAFDTLGVSTLVSTVDHANEASARVAMQLGGLRDRVAEAAHGDAIQVFRYAPKRQVSG